MNNIDAYNLHRDKFQTGDLLLFSGNGIISDIIKVFSNSKWSHCGLVIKNLDMDMLMLFESTTLSNLPDVDDGKVHRGVQCVELSRRVATYAGDISFRKLSGDVSTDMLKTLGEFRKEVHGRAYEKRPFDLINALVDLGGITDNDVDLSSLFCSELIAESLQRVGILSDKMPSSEYIPKDFRKGGMIDKYILPGYSYGDEIIIKEKCNE